MEPQHYIILANTLLSALTLAYTVMLNRSKASSAWAGKMEASQADILRRLGHLEGEITHLPSDEQIHRVEVMLSDMKGEMNVLSERMKPIAATTARIQEQMLAQGGGLVAAHANTIIGGVR